MLDTAHFVPSVREPLCQFINALLTIFSRKFNNRKVNADIAMTRVVATYVMNKKIEN